MADTPSSPSGKSPPDDIVGWMAGEYRLRRKLGEGAFGAVYEAEHPLLKRRAAVKVLRQVSGRDSEAVLRFISEAQAANQIRSRHILDVFSFGQLPDGRHFYVMDLLDGEALDRFLDREQRLPVPAAVQILQGIAAALDAAHAAHIVHRDLKPQNIFLAWNAAGEAVPKLLDFGMAKLLGESTIQTLSGTPMGTPLYMSPEQARGEKVDGRSDVYALGVLSHQLLTGTLPIVGGSTITVLMAHIMQPAPRASESLAGLSPELDEPILRMLAKDPQGRPATAGEAIAALELAAQRAGHIVPAGMPHLTRPVRGASDDLGAAPGKAPEPARTTNPQTRTAEPVARSFNWPFLAVLVALGGTLAYVVANKMNTATPAAPAVSAAPTPAPPRPAPPVPEVVPAPPLPAPHPPVAVTVRGAPRGARVFLDGQLLGEAPGPVAVPFGESAVELTVTSPGHPPVTVSVTPSQAVEVRLKRRAPGASAPPGLPRDLESPF
jgi:hypothetical protein